MMRAEIAPPAPGDADDGATSLYRTRLKIHPRSISGPFTTWRLVTVWLTQLIFYGMCWLPWHGRQAVLFEVAERKFYLFGLVFWPQDVFFLAVLLIISAYALFLFTAVAGRLWCGYSCPQTVYTEIFLWLEKLIEGDRNARIKLDKEPLNSHKLIKRATKYFLWAALALWTGFTFVGYFTPIKVLAKEMLTFDLGPWEWFWFLFYSIFTYLLAGHLREQVCLYMCPYARFQAVMFDPDTLVVTYDTERGEPRGARRKGLDYKAAGKGDCVDCELCVAVCPTGIDIRNGLQYECIGCSACIDVCNQVMDRMDYPHGLIRYSTEHAIAEHWGWKEILSHIVRPRIVIYSTILAVIVFLFVWGLAHKASLRVDVIRDRAILAREVENGLIENVYRLQVMNVTELPQRYVLAVTGLEGIAIAGEHLVSVPAAATQSVMVSVRVPDGVGNRGANVIYFDVQSLAEEGVMSVHEKTTFLMP